MTTRIKSLQSSPSSNPETEAGRVQALAMVQMHDPGRAQLAVPALHLRAPEALPALLENDQLLIR